MMTATTSLPQQKTADLFRRSILAKSDLPPKNRVWGFESVTGSCTGFIASQVVDAHQETSDTSTKTVSGRPNGNITDYVDTNGTVVAHYEYGPFGQIIAKSGTKADDFKFRFSSKYYDEETGLYYYGYRMYSPELGRWPSRDPIGERGGLMVYGFAGNNAVNYVDLLGAVYLDYAPDPLVGAPFSWVDYLKRGERYKDGYTREMHTEIQCGCVCKEGDGPWKLECTIYWWDQIEVARTYYDGFHSRGMSPEKLEATVKGIYGHEQRHVQAGRWYVEKNVVPYVEGKEKKSFGTESDCENTASEVERLGNGLLKTQRVLWKGHRADMIEGDENPYVPRDGIPEDPLEGEFFMERGAVE